MTASASFELDPGTGTYAPGPAAVSSAGATVNARLLSVSGVVSISWTVIGTSAAAVATPTVTLSGSPLGQIASFSFAAGDGNAYILECQVNGGPDVTGDAATKFSGKFYSLFANGAEPVAVNETSESSATHYTVEILNGAIGGAASEGGITAWASYTPGFSATGGSPSLGNGSASGKWRRVGDSIEFTAQYLFGTTTNYGTGALLFDVFGDGPIGSIDDSKILAGSAGMAGTTFLQDSSVPLVVPVYPQYVSGSTVKLLTVDIADVEGTVPFTFANGDSIYISGTVPILVGG